MNITVKQILSWIEWHDIYRNLYPGYDNDSYINEYEDDYYFDTKEQAIETVENIIGIFESLKSTPLIPIYRAMHVKSIDDLDMEFLGDFWSWELDSAKEFGSKVGANIIIHALTPPNNVDWDISIKSYLAYSLGMNSDSEEELFIKDSIPLKVLKITTLSGKILYE